MDRSFPLSRSLLETCTQQTRYYRRRHEQARLRNSAVSRVLLESRENNTVVTSEDASLLLPTGYDKTGWLAPKRRRSRVDVTKQGCLVRKAGQRTVRLTVAPGSWIVPTHLLFLLLFLRNTLIENPLDPFDHVFDAWCLLRAWGKTWNGSCCGA